MIILKINKSLLVTMKPGVHIEATGLIGHSAEMNKRIGKNIAANEQKIELGMRKAQRIQM